MPRLIPALLCGLLAVTACKTRTTPAQPPVATTTPPATSQPTPPAPSTPPTTPPSSVPEAATVPSPTIEEAPRPVLAKLTELYQDGEISRCTHQGQTVYVCARNAYDAGSEVFDAKGQQIGVCYYSTRRVDPVCTEAQDCKVIYRVNPNIWGKPGVELMEK